MRILVTGGSGFIGQYLCRHLDSLGHEVTTFDLRHPSEELEKVHYYTGNVSEIRFWRDIHGFDYDCLIHLASVVGVKAVSSQRITTTNTILEGIRNALWYCQATRTPIVYASTSEVYGNAPSPLYEDKSESLLGLSSIPRWGYAAAKLAAEHMVLGYQEELGVKAAIVRPFNVTGPGQSQMVLPTFVSQATKNKPITINGDGSQVRCFIAVQDAVEALTKLAMGLVIEDLGNGEIFNLGNPGNQSSIWNLAEQVKRQVGSDSPIVISQRTDEIFRRIPDITKISNLINWYPTRNLASIINAMANMSSRSLASN
ncbi:MAG: NAD(P)-dependent oxidoreductase [Nostoc sp.]|uniref:NAD-dependent epimerase/dehydratase family protein n=1 Tax=Nostoc sp. TaxID=1180 RepID=UPI002FF6A9B2